MSEEEHLKEREITPDSLDDPHRIEMMWTKKNESLLTKWREEMNQKILHHHNKAKLNKTLFYTFGIPSILIPIVISGLTTELNDSPEILTYLLISSGLVSGINAFLNFQKKVALHEEYENRYDELQRLVQKILYTPKVSRVAADVVINDIYLKLCFLNSNAPE
jgi:hypothetical protein